jgi:hypothetical protein
MTTIASKYWRSLGAAVRVLITKSGELPVEQPTKFDLYISQTPRRYDASGRASNGLSRGGIGLKHTRRRLTCLRVTSEMMRRTSRHALPLLFLQQLAGLLD